ncbi:hypothetical protein CL614_00300 [archaeon]|nr:hypothetical protein [archaeon]|tara:strand:- start:11 stop:994 length:984 start_codon:yes stop_codon:yes gene_type:complete
MPFRKWTGIENSYNSKFIDGFLEVHPKLKTERFFITEKIDGANFSIVFFKEGRIQFAKRSGWIESDESFYNYKAILQDPLMEKFVEVMKEFCMKHERTIQFVGELFGLGVQKRVYYGDGRYWRWFGIYEHTNGEFKNLDISEMQLLADNIYNDFDEFDIDELRTVILDIVDGFNEAVSYMINFDSLYTPEDYDKENLIEGVVIRPLHNYWMGDHNAFIIKKKNEKFKDNQRAPKEKKTFNVSEDLQSIHDIAIGMVNENRTADLFSKHGPIEKMSQFGDYIGFYMKDITDEIKKLYPLDFSNLSKVEQKWLHKQVVTLAKEELKNNL